MTRKVLSPSPHELEPLKWAPCWHQWSDIGGDCSLSCHSTTIYFVNFAKYLALESSAVKLKVLFCIWFQFIEWNCSAIRRQKVEMWDNSIDWSILGQTTIWHAGMPLLTRTRPARPLGPVPIESFHSDFPLCPPRQYVPGVLASSPAAGAGDATNFIARPALFATMHMFPNCCPESFHFTAQISKLPSLQTRGK